MNKLTTFSIIKHKKINYYNENHILAIFHCKLTAYFLNIKHSAPDFLHEFDLQECVRCRKMRNFVAANNFLGLTSGFAHRLIIMFCTCKTTN